MLQLACVLTTGGVLLFSSAVCPSEIFTTIINRILESKLTECEVTVGTYNIRYSFDSLIGLIFIAVWRREIILTNVDKFLKFFNETVGGKYTNQVKTKGDIIVDSPNFSNEFRNAFEKWNTFVAVEKSKQKVMSTFHGKKIGNEKKQAEIEKEIEEQEVTVSQNKLQTETKQQTEEDDEGSLSPRERFLKNQQKRKSQNIKKNPSKEQKSGNRQWQTSNKTLSKSDIDKLDRSKSRESYSKSGKYLEEEQKQVEGFIDSDQEIKQSSFFKKIVGNIQGVIGNKSLTKQDLQPVLQMFKTQLMDKNVAQEVADKITQSVGQTLLQTKTKSFTSVQATVKTAIREALVKILTPAKEINIIAEVSKAKQNHKPYVITFIGVNGVGKSTNLAKVAFMLKNAGFSVMLAACDVFRAGAIEQLKVHGANIDISVFDRGYKEEPPEVAYQAIKQATQKRIDVVLIDTAGRMQDNTPLMKALARLVDVNKPNLIVFIGQALVGNDAVDQISKFNQALSQFSADDSKRQIDGIILSKFDTVDDKVGTAVSMCYTTSKPVLYVGVGQKYPNLRKLNISTIVQSLLS